MKSGAGSLFVLLLLHPTRLRWQQFGEIEIGSAQSIHLGRFDVIVNETKDVGAPGVSRLFIRAQLGWEQRLIFALLLRRARLFAFPSPGAALVIGHPSFKQPSHLRAGHRQLQSVDHLDLALSTLAVVPPSTDDDGIVIVAESRGKIRDHGHVHDDGFCKPADSDDPRDARHGRRLR